MLFAVGCLCLANDFGSAAATVAYVPELASAACADVAVERALPFAIEMAAVGDVDEADLVAAGVGDEAVVAGVVLSAPGESVWGW